MPGAGGARFARPRQGQSVLQGLHVNLHSARTSFVLLRTFFSLFDAQVPPIIDTLVTLIIES